MATSTLQPAWRSKVRPTRKRNWPALVVLGCWVLLAASVWLRVWKLDTLPGINGDEAWYGVQAQELLAGESVSWLTPTGNLLNVFFFGPLVLLHAVSKPDFVLLRLPAVISGLAALALNYWFCRRLFDKTTAVLSTLLIAVMPLNIAYSRMGWDASQSLLATAAVLYVSLSAVEAPAARRGRWYAGAVLALCAAVMVHPTNVFAAPLVLAAIAFAWREDAASKRGRPGNVVGAACAIAAVLGVIALVGFLSGSQAEMIEGRTGGRWDVFGFVSGFLRLMSGVTSLQYFAGSVSRESGLDVHRAVYDLAAALVLILSGWGMYRQVRERGSMLDRCLAVGWLGTVAGFFVVAGSQALAPHWERYGIVLVAPTALVVARGGAWWLSRTRLRSATATGLVAIGFVWLAGFYLDYFMFLGRTGGQSHVALRTAAVEPKRAALEYILANSDPNDRVEIVAGDWWSYWPLRYLAGGQARVRVDAYDEGAQGAGSSRGGVWFVDFAEHPELPVRLRAVSGRTALVERATVLDAGERPLVQIFGPPK